MNRKLSRRIFNTGLGLVVLLVLLWCVLQKDWICWVCIGIFILNFIQQAVFDKCPHCGEWFSFRAKEPAFCPRCGKKLDE